VCGLISTLSVKFCIQLTRSKSLTSDNEQRAQPVNLEAIKIIKDSLQCPVIANGDIKSLEDAEKIAEFTGVNGQLHEYCQFEDFNRYKYVYLFHFI
jgi:2,4-dienoyl-CoA reductase-like NADH-dependent reductase (Old Yellow Enzyme family)